MPIGYSNRGLECEINITSLIKKRGPGQIDIQIWAFPENNPIKWVSQIKIPNE